MGGAHTFTLCSRLSENSVLVPHSAAVHLSTTNQENIKNV